MIALATTGLSFTAPFAAVILLAITWAVLGTCGCSSTREHRVDPAPPLADSGDLGENPSARILFDTGGSDASLSNGEAGLLSPLAPPRRIFDQEALADG